MFSHGMCGALVSAMDRPKYVIVVGIDYSAAAERALGEAFELSLSKRGAQLHVANVRSAASLPAELRAARPPWAEWASELREYVAHQAASFEVNAGIEPFRQLYTHQRLGDPAHELAQLAADLEADLVVVGTHDWHGVARLVLGSVAEGVTRLAPCPVLVVRRKALPPAVPTIEPPCPECVATRRASSGARFWCAQHSEHHGRRHTYHQGDHSGDATNFPLVTPR